MDSVIRFMKDMKEYQGTLWAPCFSADSMAICINITKYYNLTENNFVLGYPSHLQTVQTFWRSRGLRGRISTGFYLVNVAISQCRELNLYGFWPFLQDVDETVKDIPYHYFDKAKYSFDKNHSIHDMHYEFSVLVQLHLLGVLKIHVGGCNH
ncbi:Alpha-2,8-sialyltransferase 8F [Holothuria leucospilota]|uniref:Alpha-2,8-sialyltransferase 8F n=1 Tax=Holothuria leucospilota TaxID=206669 RepID=A0A9Q1C7V5_HOLLE|nr:Alpha-2,8-sialyltransferase 8F [Holothuria leucospilota]